MDHKREHRTPPPLARGMGIKWLSSCAIAQFNFERAVEGSILTAGKRLSLKNLNVIIRAIN